ncbi:hypothetical protein ZIOFF_003653 [Zingiber officinale]|uniref:NB-ARC domain-containing protein n=1 Tax=Zingiber officinale TaxID=94328 RepID=A0A8J5LTM5_ZINOF|nr:hypothetical protein ZIOFF_003653 [Zingiber officinale]
MDPSHDDYATILSEEVIGREDEDQIIDLLQQQCDEDGNEPFIIAINGSKYSGKTTLARKIYHHPWVRQHFQHRIWLDASSFRDFNSSMIAIEIARLLTRKPCMNVNCWPLINEHLGGDRYLLIFDDVCISDVLKYKWEELKLNLLHCGAPGSKVILVGYIFNRDGREFNVKKYILNHLREDAWVRILLRYATFVRPIKGNNNIHREKASPTVTDILIPLAKKFRQDYDSGDYLGAKCMGLMFRWRDKSQWGELANQLFNIKHLHKYFLSVHQQYRSIEDTRSSLYKLLFEGSKDESYDEDVLYMLIAEDTLTNTRLKRNLQIMSFKFNLDQCFFRMKLNMHGCASLTIMPSGIRQLTNLEVLLGYDAMDGLGNVMFSELRALTNLESLHIQHLERLVLAEAEAKEKDKTEPTILQENQHLNELMLHWAWWNDMVAEGTFEPTLQLTQGFHRNLEELKVLRIVSYMSIKLPSWLIMDRDSVLNKLTTIHLVNLRRCERLPELGLLRQLEEVVISGFDLVRVIDDDFYEMGRRVPFYGLKRFTLSEMPMLEKWDLPIYFKRRLRWIKVEAKIKALVLAKADFEVVVKATTARAKAEAWVRA